MKKEKKDWLSRKMEGVYLIIYLSLSLYLRKNLFMTEPLPTLRIFYPIIFGILMMVSGLSSLRKKEFNLYGVMKKGPGTTFPAALLILGALYFMFFVGR